MVLRRPYALIAVERSATNVIERRIKMAPQLLQRQTSQHAGDAVDRSIARRSCDVRIQSLADMRTRNQETPVQYPWFERRLVQSRDRRIVHIRGCSGRVLPVSRNGGG